MKELFYMGGPLFMGLLTLVLIAILSVYGYTIYRIRNGSSPLNLSESVLKELGLFALILGITGQFIGLFDAFSAIEQMGAVAPAMLMSGLKVSMITTLYGMFISLFALLLHVSISFLKTNRS